MAKRKFGKKRGTSTASPIKRTSLKRKAPIGRKTPKSQKLSRRSTITTPRPKGYKRVTYKRAASAGSGAMVKQTTLSGRRKINTTRSGKVYVATKVKHRDQKRDNRGRFV